MAIISALNKYVSSDDEVTIYSNSKNTVNTLNNEFAMNDERLRDLALEAWVIIAKFSTISIVLVSVKENLTAKMLEI